MTVSIMTFIISKLSIKIFYVTLSITTFSISIHSIEGICVTVSITVLRHYPECTVLFLIMLNFVLLNVAILSAVAL